MTMEAAIRSGRLDVGLFVPSGILPGDDVRSLMKAVKAALP